MNKVYSNALLTEKTVSVTDSAQSPIVGREKEMEPNRGGGYGFRTDFETYITRIIILGTSKGYYSSAKDNTEEAVSEIKKYLSEGKGFEILKIVKDVYEKGRAAKQDPTFVVLALLCRHEDLELRRASWELVTKIRTFSHLCTFLNYYGKASKSKGWGRLPKSSLEKWVLQQEPRDLTYQVFKYLSREGWTFRDMLRCIHIDPTSLSSGMKVVLKLMSKYGSKNSTTEESFKTAFDFAKEINAPESDVEYLRGIMYMKTVTETDVKYEEMIQKITQHNFTREFLPTWALNNVEVWANLLYDSTSDRIKMPLTALIRNLGVMTVRGVFTKNPNLALMVSEYIKNEQVIRKSHIHPATLVIAWKQYATGHSDKGSSTWTPEPVIVNALEKSINISFGNVEATNKRIYHCFDGSGSMTCPMHVVSCMTSAEAVGLLGLVCSKSEKPETQRYCIFSNNRSNGPSYSSLSSGLAEIKMIPGMSLAAAAKITQLTNWSSTNIALPFDNKITEFRNAFAQLSFEKHKQYEEALKTNNSTVLEEIRTEMKIFLPEVFVIYTDNDVNSGRHPSLALEEYRKVTGINARLAVVATQASNISITDPKDNNQMNFVGFDSQLPQLLHDFIAGEI